MYEDGQTSEQPFHRLNEGEAFLRDNNRLNYPDFWKHGLRSD